MLTYTSRTDSFWVYTKYQVDIGDAEEQLHQQG